VDWTKRRVSTQVSFHLRVESDAHKEAAMKSTPSSGVLSGVLASLLLASHAAAQTPAQSFTDLQPLLKPGQRVIVTDGKGLKTTGRVVSLLGNQLEIEERRLQIMFSEGSVRRVEADDSTWNGALIGAGVGLLLGVLAVKNPSANSEGEEMGLLGAGPLIGYFLGEAIDRETHRLLYVSPGTSGMTFVPLVGRARVGIAAAIRF
jgi:hypothetical protein